MKKRADGRYQAKVTLPSGKTKFVYGRTQKELKAKRDELMIRYAMGATNLDSKTTVQGWAEQWWNVVKEGRTGNSSQEGYLLAMNNYIFPFMGQMKIKDVKPINCQELINDMGENGKSQSLQKKVLIALNGMFEYAVKNGLMVGNPAQYTELYEVPIREIEAYTSKEVEAIVEACQGLRAEIAIHLALYCGLRRGEIAAAKYTDLDEVTQTIHVQNAVEFIKNRPREKGPKSTAGDRYIPVPDHLWEMLMGHTEEDVLIVPSAKGTQMSRQATIRLLEPLQRRVDFPIRYHRFRHTYATLLDILGVGPKTCQYLLGHKTYSTTKNIYTHIQDEHLDAVKVQLQEYLQSLSRKKEDE